MGALFSSSDHGRRRPRSKDRTCYQYVRKHQHRGVKLLFVAGMEHTGHKLWHGEDWFDVHREGLIQALRLPKAEQASKEAYLSIRRYGNGCAGNVDAMTRSIASDARELRRSDGGGSSSAMFLAGCSYPCDTNPRQRGSPDVNLFARAAEAASVDFRALVLTRPASETVYDKLKDENAGSSGFRLPRLQALLRHCRVLRQQLESLDADFWACVPYHSYREGWSTPLRNWSGLELGPEPSMAFRASHGLSRHSIDLPRHFPYLPLTFHGVPSGRGSSSALCWRASTGRTQGATPRTRGAWRA